MCLLARVICSGKPMPTVGGVGARHYDRSSPQPELPAVCLPGEEPLVDLDMLSDATRLLVATVPPPDDDT